MSADELDSRGMVVDFHDLDRLLGEAIEPFEHRHLNEVEPFDEINPSSENIARVVFERVASTLGDARVNVVCCDVFENDLSKASYSAGTTSA